MPELVALSSEQACIAHQVAKWISDDALEHSVPDTIIVRGVFGSGKSRTLAACIALLDRLLSAQKDPRRILLVCHTNVAVDNVLSILVDKHGWDDFVRLGSFKAVKASV